MTEVKWIKITTDMFDNRKIRYLRRLPDGNNIVLIWIMLLTIAGRCNSGGKIFLTENIPYTTKMLADELDFKENTIRTALQALEQLSMVVTDGAFYSVVGWEEHQNTEGMEKLREQNRMRQKKWYDKQKDRPAPNVSPNVSPNVRITQPNATDIDKEGDKDIDRDREEDIEEDTKSKEVHSNPGNALDAETPEETPRRFGSYQNVFLTDAEYERLRAEFPHDFSERIERLSEYIASTGKSYQNHLATIRSWARKDAEKREKNGNIFREIAQEEGFA